MRRDTMGLNLAVLCFIVAAYLVIALFVALLGGVLTLFSPGIFLFSRFHLMGFYVPGVLILAAHLLRSGHRPRRTLSFLWVSPIPFLVITLLLHILRGDTGLWAPHFLISALGRSFSILICFLSLALIAAGMIRLGRLYPEPEDGLFDPARFWTRLKKRLSSFFFNDFPERTETAPQKFQTMHVPGFPEAPVEPKDAEAEERQHIVSHALRRLSPDPQDQRGESSGRFTDFSPMGFPNSSASSPELASKADSGGEEIFVSFDRSSSLSRYDDMSRNFEEDGNVMTIHDLESSAFQDVQKDGNHTIPYQVPVRGLLNTYTDADFATIDADARRKAQILEETLQEFNIEAHVTGIRRGPVITMFELLPSPGVKISRIVNLQDNITLRLAASRVRIVAPIPGKHAVGIEVPNTTRAIVSFSALVESDEFRQSDAALPVILGKGISGDNQVMDLTRTPHLLIAGATGSGKSVCVNSLIGSILYSRTPEQVKLIMVDPKIVELKLYTDIPHLLAPVITEPKKALQALQWCLYEMERRYTLLDSQGVRDIASYNRKLNGSATEIMPYIVVIVDEFSDLMATSGKELEGIVARLAAMSRAVGIHLVLATQRPSVDVITGLIKANFPSRIAFMVAGKTDSRIIIDSMGAEKLLGRGDMLFTSAWNPFPARIQGSFLAEEEVERMTEYVKSLGRPDYITDEMFLDDEDDEEFQLETAGGEDPMYEKALEIVVSSRKASASYIQRRLKLGYNRAARLVEEMERRGIVGPANGSKPRELLHVPDSYSPLGLGGANGRPSD